MQSNKSSGQMTAQINLGGHKKSGFDLSNNVLGTGKIGRIIPTRALHVMPGDTIKGDSKVAVQFEPLAVPILANMDVKQEQFYIPYNVVWRNWDKFISGGEKMDYQGVVPNKSMKQIAHALFEQMRLYGCNLPLAISPTTDQRANHLDTNDKNLAEAFIMFGGDSYYSGIISPTTLDTFGYGYQAKDLLKPQYEVLKQVVTWRQTSWDNLEPLFYIFKPSGAPAKVESDFREMVSKYEFFTSKYLQQLVDGICTRWQTPTPLAQEPIAIPTNQGVSFLQLMYEYYKPFLGIGSNLDYLNMARMTFTDFLWLWIQQITDFYKSGDYTLDDEVMVELNTDYFSTLPMNMLHLRANYNVWYNNYRDILLEADAKEPYDGDTISDVEIVTLLFPRQRCWEKDAFTTALDNPGTGNVGVPVSRTGGAPLVVKTTNAIASGDSVASKAQNNDMEIAEIEFQGETWKLPTAFLSGQNELVNQDNTSFNGFSLFSLDAAQRAQKWLQKALYYGNRINDFFAIRFGVRYLDARLRLPELLTSSTELVKIDVLMNNTTTAESIAGDRAGFASAYDNGSSFDRFIEEHGVIMSYLTIMPQVTYAYGMSRDYSRLDQFDYAFPEFATLGMDAVYDTEITSIAVKNGINEESLVFGYQGKYYDYKAKHSEEHGELLDSQDMYTFARFFNMYSPDGRPKLNYEFVHCFPDLDMFVVDDEFSDYFRYDIRHSTAAERELPIHSIYI